MKRIFSLAIVASLAMFVTACGDPLENVESANTSGAKEVKEESGDKYAISKDDSTVGWTGTKTGGKHDGGFKDFSGHVVVRDDKIVQVDVTIQIKSMWTDDDDKSEDEDKLKGHLLSDDFFSADEYKTARFVTTEIKPAADPDTYNVTGNLTLRGKTKSINFPATITLKDGMVKANAEFKIDRMEWGVEFTIPGGEVILHNEVAIRFDIVANK